MENGFQIWIYAVLYIETPLFYLMLFQAYFSCTLQYCTMPGKIQKHLCPTRNG
jgi:hypothetical protein